jgi:hypothetical protein
MPGSCVKLLGGRAAGVKFECVPHCSVHCQHILWLQPQRQRQQQQHSTLEFRC